MKRLVLAVSLAVLAAGWSSVGAVAVPVAVGEASVIAAGVEARAGAAGSFASVAAAMPVAVGDAVRTDATGYAEIAYLDGSRTRLDVNTEFEVLELTDEAGVASTRTSMTLGRTWHRVESLGEGDGGFSVVTSQATAVVVGTAFAIECLTDTACSYLVVEGVVELTLADGSVVQLVAPSSVSVTNGVAGAVTPLPWDGAFGDPWLSDNAGRDVAAGFADPGTVYQAHGPAFGSLTGTFTGTRTMTSLECVAVCDPTTPPVGDVAERSYTFALDCAATPCSGSVESPFQIDAADSVELLPLTFDGTTYTWNYSTTFGCNWDDDGDGVTDRVTGSATSELSWAMVPTAGEVRDGVWTVTALEGTASAVNVVIDTGGCTDGNLGNTNASSITVSR